ncbi:RNA polymerase II-associated, partial [Pseudomassariella vexata]
MASSSRNSEHRSIHQDFIARIRFSNALPPPPNPPKLLDIPNTGLASGQYTAPGFASRLAREQPLNIEADAELGMPLDLVGMPGIFDGDESSIQAPTQPPRVHPHDAALLKPLHTLGKPKIGEAAVSFLRRTEYISSVTTKSSQSATPLRGFTAPIKRLVKRKSPEPDIDSPAYVKRKIDQSFTITEQNLKDRNRVKHPSKKNLKLVESYPLLPDPEAWPDSGTYVTMKFTHNPVPGKGSYDTRMLNGIFRPLNRSQEEEDLLDAAMEAWKIDPVNNPKPDMSMSYDFYLAESGTSAEKFRKRFDMDNPERDNDSLYTSNRSSGPCFQFSRLRAYETAQESELDHSSKYDEELILGFNDNETALHQKAAYFYPVMQRSTIRPQRTKNIARTIGMANDDEKIIEQLDVKVDDPTEEVLADMERFKEDPYGLTIEPPQEEDGMAEDGEHHENGDAEANGLSQRHTPDSEEDVDAEGDED